MAVLHDFQCATCDYVFEAMVAVAHLPAGPPCPSCAATDTIRIFQPPRVVWRPDAVVVYQAPDGSFRYPGDTGGASCAKYDALGYQRLEARGVAEVRRLEQRLNAYESSHMARLDERRLALTEQGERLRRSDLFHKMASMSNAGKAIARAAIALHNQRGHRRVGSHPGIHVEAYSDNRSTRGSKR